MKLIVNPHKIQLIQEQAVNEKEIDISRCEFEFSEEITNDFVKEAYFTYGDKSYKKIIVNNQCTFPQEVLVKEGTVELGVVAYKVEDEEEIKRYNPTPVYFKTDLGSLKEAENSEEPTPSEMEQYEQALQDGLTAVDERLTEANTVILEASNLNITGQKTENVTYITLTDKQGNDTTLEVLDGVDGTDGVDGKDGRDGIDGKDGKDGTDGTNGIDGFSPVASVSKSGNTATITITDKNGTTTTTVSDGTNGTNGTDGRDGYVQYTAGNNITIENNTISATIPEVETYCNRFEYTANNNQKVVLHSYTLGSWSATGEYSLETISRPVIQILNDVRSHYVSGAVNKVYIRLATPNFFGSAFYVDNMGSTPTNLVTTEARESKLVSVRYAISYTDNVITGISQIGSATTNSDYGYLSLSNMQQYTPSSNYNPATKKYVDDSISNKIWIGTQTQYDNLGSYSDSTLYFIKEDTNVSQ